MALRNGDSLYEGASYDNRKLVVADGDTRRFDPKC